MTDNSTQHVADVLTGITSVFDELKVIGEALDNDQAISQDQVQYLYNQFLKHDIVLLQLSMLAATGHDLNGTFQTLLDNRWLSK